MRCAVAGDARSPVAAEQQRQVEIVRRAHPTALHRALPQQAVGENRCVSGLALGLQDAAETEPPVRGDGGIDQGWCGEHAVGAERGDSAPGAARSMSQAVATRWGSSAAVKSKIVGSLKPCMLVISSPAAPIRSLTSAAVGGAEGLERIAR